MNKTLTIGSFDSEDLDEIFDGIKEKLSELDWDDFKKDMLEEIGDELSEEDKKEVMDCMDINDFFDLLEKEFNEEKETDENKVKLDEELEILLDRN